MMNNSFLSMMDNYDERKVERYDDKDGRMVSTAAVTDGKHPYETAIEHSEYAKGNMIIVEAYNTREEAVAGHARWVTTITKGPLPKEIKDCLNSGVSQLSSAAGNNYTFKREQE